MKNLVFREETLNRLNLHLKSNYPNEACGFLYGFDSNVREIIDVLPVKNVKEGDQRRRFEIDPLDYIKAEEHAKISGLTLLGIYHSHPDHPAIPSEHDLKQAVPFFSYVISSIIKGEVTKTTSWQLNEKGVFNEEKIQQKTIENTLV